MNTKFIIIRNLSNFGQADYKGLDIDKFIAGSPVYKKDMSECVIVTTEETMPSHADLTEITEVDYTAYRDAIKAEQQAEITTIEQLKVENENLKTRVADLELQVATLSGSTTTTA